MDVKVKTLTTDKFPTKAKRPKYSLLVKSKIKDVFGIDVPQWKNSLKKMLEK